MRILICNWRDLAHPLAGGAEVYAHELARHWVATGHEVTQFSATVPGRPHRGRRDGVRIVRGGGRYSVYNAARRWYHRQGRNRFDLIVDAVNTRPFGCAQWAGDTPTVALVHQVCREIWFHEMRWPLAAIGRWVAEPWWLHRLRDVHVFTVSESSRESLHAYGLRRVDVVGVGSRVTTRPPVVRETRPTVIYVGRLASNKRPHDALAAFDVFRRQFPAAQMWVIGDGPQRAQLQHRFPDHVHFYGRVDEPTRDALLARAHVLVVTSVREGWGMVVDEAAAMGTPTIGYDVPGLRDSIPAAGGTLVPPTIEALADGLARGLPTWLGNGADAGWCGGARDWSHLADDLLVRACSPVGTPSTVALEPGAL